MKTLIHRDDPRIERRIEEIRSLLNRNDFNPRQRQQARLELGRFSDCLLKITPKYDGFNSDYRHLQTVKRLDRLYRSIE